MNFSTKIIYFVICLALLFTLQIKVVVPFLFDVASSDLFLEGEENFMDAEVSNNSMLGFAFDQCNNHISEQLDSDFSIIYASKPINAWSLGGNQYVINAEVDITPPDGQSAVKRYVCRIVYTQGTDINGTLDSSNWDIEGINGIDEL